MKFKSIVFLLVFQIFASGIFASQDKMSWESLSDFVNNDVAVHVKGRGMVYGTLATHDATKIEVDLVSNGGETEIRRESVKKLWLAELNVKKRRAKEGALMGAGIGALITYIPMASEEKEDREGYGRAFLVTTVGGAAIGGIIGLFKKKNGHRKLKLIYRG